MPKRTTPAANPAQITEILERCGLPVVERCVLPARAASFRPVPSGLHPAVRSRLRDEYVGGLYAHQAFAIELALAGGDVCLATATASGKSAPFMAMAAHILLSDPGARVLALYPMKALIRDQLAKWESSLAPLGIDVGHIDGAVAMDQRGAILRSSRVVAMTPDVAHAWLMSRPNDKDVAPFLRSLRLLILDEAHVYEGVFGTNMAYFLRRLAVVAGPYRVICSTATLGEAEASIERLIGRRMTVLGPEEDGSAGFEKKLLLVRADPKSSFESVVKVLKTLATSVEARFLAFADSRKAVERLTAAAHRQGRSGDDDLGAEDAGLDRIPAERLLPYRAGYEEEDRRKIQAALTSGGLAGVVSTSALELGIDIGDIDIVVLTNSPPTVKAFHQRIGRAGRRRPAVCVVVDDLGVMESLEAYARRPVEPGWIYLDNRYIQYSQALCAAAELQSIGVTDAYSVSYPGLPESFARFVRNELDPREPIEDDLFPLKQQAQSNPHYEFPIRSSAEPNFAVKGQGTSLGTLSYAQLLREGYPGAVYYYMARPHRAYRVEHRKREVHVKREAFITTQPTTQAAVFVEFGTGVLQAAHSPDGFLAEVDLQVSERVIGFTEQRGRSKVPHLYGPTSSYSQKPLTRYFRTTGVCWAFPAKLTPSEALARRVMLAFCRVCGVLERDLGYAVFHAANGPFDTSPVQGMVVYDATHGSLRLTQRLVGRLADVLVVAADMDTPELRLDSEIAAFAALATKLEPATVVPAVPALTTPSDWAEVIAAGERAMLADGPSGPMEVTVVTHRYTPHGLMYELANDKPSQWLVGARRVRALPGLTRTIRVNLVTGEERTTMEPRAA